MDWDEDDEGWMWLPWEELMEIQRQRNEVMRQMLDSVYLASKPLYVVSLYTVSH